MRVLLASALILAAPAAAQTGPIYKGEAPKPDKKVCRIMESTTGSHFPGHRVCRTKAEWTAINTANGDDARNFGDGMTRGAGQANESKRF